MPQPKFDNLNDVISKFVNTICYYKDDPVFVKTAFHSDDDANQFLLSVSAPGMAGAIVDVHNPDFRYVNYNLGYSNGHSATWWYRRPAKQYQQGLKAEQLRYFAGDDLLAPKSQFQFSKPYIEMLRNKYPNLDASKKSVRDGMTLSAAWHRDFAVSWDDTDKCYYLWYRANRIGVFGVLGPKLFPEANYIKEALQEAMSQCNN